MKDMARFKSLLAELSKCCEDDASEEEQGEKPEGPHEFQSPGGQEPLTDTEPAAAVDVSSAEDTTDREKKKGARKDDAIKILGSVLASKMKKK